MWSVLFENKKVKEFETRKEVDDFLSNLGSVIREYYSVSVDTGNADVDRMLVEGLVKGDLERIVLPRLSVDEYVPADPETDNIVLAFYVKGVPEAVLPFKNFAEKSRGVLSTDFGDSETILNASIVYVEYDRENIDIKHIDELMTGVAKLCNIKSNEFTITFPHTNEKFPYKPELIKEYFDSRNERKNRMAQQKALDAAKEKLEKEIAAMRQEREQPEQEEQTNESLVEDLVNAFPSKKKVTNLSESLFLSESKRTVIQMLSNLYLTANGKKYQFGYEQEDYTKELGNLILELEREDRIVWMARYTLKMLLLELKHLVVKEDDSLTDDTIPEWPDEMEKKLRKLDWIKFADFPFQGFDFNPSDLPRGVLNANARSRARKEFMNSLGSDENEMFKYVGWFSTDTHIRQMVTTIKHFISMGKVYAKDEPQNELLTYQFNRQPFPQVVKDLRKIERELEKKYKENPEVSEGETIVQLSDGWKWVMLSSESCGKEGKAMGHCGNVGTARPSQRVLSLREPHAKGDIPHLTFILDTADGSLGEMKGRKNSTPARKYHSYILKLLELPIVKSIKGGGYRPRNNFSLEHLSAKHSDALQQVRPDLFPMNEMASMGAVSAGAIAATPGVFGTPTKKKKKKKKTENLGTILYHATYKPFLDSIMKNGLGGHGAQAQWEDSKPGYVYLAKDPHVAISYAETNDEVPEEYLDNIVLLNIDVSQLNQDNLEEDPNVLDDDSTLAYRGIIPKNAFNVTFTENNNEDVVSKTNITPSTYKGKYLFHDTDKQSAKNILKHDYFRVQKGWGVIGLSTHYKPEGEYHKRGVRFVLDRNKLEKDFELVRIEEPIGFDEYEIKVVSDSPITNASKYIIDVFDTETDGTDVVSDLKAEFPGINIDLYDTSDGYILSKIVVPEDDRGFGIGTLVMKKLIEQADKEDKIIALTPDTTFGASSKSRLVNFYKRFGFVPNKGRKKDFRFRETMIRYPKINEVFNIKKDKKTILELFDRKAEWSWVNPSDTPFSMMNKSASFKIGDVEYIAGFGELMPSSWMFGFIANVNGEWKENKIGTGNEMMVFSTIMQIIEDFIAQESPNELMVGGLPERERLYTRILRRNEKKINDAGYDLDGPVKSDFPFYGKVSLFTLSKR